LIDTFKYEYCVFRAVKQKKNTARVYFSGKYNINCITFEQSYGLIDAGSIGVANWRNFGTSLVDGLSEYLNLTKKGGFDKLSDYLG
jgi:hypothetical protein